MWVDLLRTDTFVNYQGDPSVFRERALAIDTKWIVIDEIQKVPALLNEVHALIAEFPDRFHFALSGSSARKLKRLDVNLLAGRVFERHMFPLIHRELNGDLTLEQLLEHGSLPKVASEPHHAVDILSAYVHTYLEQEIRQEALVANLSDFSRFLRVAAAVNGETTNIAGVARDAAVQRSTVQRYFQVLVDTLIGTWLPAWQPRFKVKEVNKPKFYFFDTGVVRALTQALREPIERAERGKLLETWLLNELRAYRDYRNIGGEYTYWRTPSGAEVDFVWTRGKRAVGIEVKSSTQWRREWCRPLQALTQGGQLDSGYGVYLGDQRLKIGDITVLPLEVFLRALHDGELFG